MIKIQLSRITRQLHLTVKNIKPNTTRGTQFRTWATDKLKNYIFKGFAIDKDRFIKGSRFDARFFDELLEEIREIRASERMVYQKITDIYSTSVDYSSEIKFI